MENLGVMRIKSKMRKFVEMAQIALSSVTPAGTLLIAVIKLCFAYQAVVCLAKRTLFLVKLIVNAVQRVVILIREENRVVRLPKIA